MAELYIEVRFIKKNIYYSTSSVKGYTYKIDKSLLNCFKDYYNSNLYMDTFPIFNIINQVGYDYHNSYVIITDISTIPFTKAKINYSTINTIDNIMFLKSSDLSSSLCCCGKNVKQIIDLLDKAKEKINPIQNIDITQSINHNKTTTLNATVDNNKYINIKGDINMNFNDKFTFGKLKNVKMSLYGPAFPTEDGKSFLCYDNTSGKWVNVEDLTFNMDGFLYAMPVAVKDIKVGDFIRHNGKWVRVNAIAEDTGIITAERPYTREIINVMPEKNIFGFDFYTKIVNIASNFGLGTGTATEDTPFGNTNALMLMALCSDEDGALLSGNGSNKFKDMLPFLMMSNMGVNGENTSTSNIFANPMMLYMLLGK